MKARSLGTALITGAFVGIFLALAFTTATADLKAARLDNGVRERQPVSTELSPNASAMAYWVSEADGWHVVTTVDTVIGRVSEAETHAVVRFSSVLLPGQSQLVSVPVAIGERQQVLRIRRFGDQIEFVRVAGSA
jgi:hypothetical protein